MSKTCQECGAKFCKYFCFEIDEPDTFEEFDDIKWFLCHEGVSVHIDEGDWYIAIDNRCKMLDADDTCMIYESRPTICRGYSPEDCDHTGGDYGYDEEFKTTEEIEKYARKFLGDKKYQRQQAKAHGLNVSKPISKKKHRTMKVNQLHQRRWLKRTNE